MLKIYYIINSIRRRFYNDKSAEFQDGFQTCLDLFDFGITKHSQFNAHVKCEELEKDCNGLRKELRDRDRQISKLKEKLNNQSLVAQGPSLVFRHYKVVLPNSEEFSIVANLKMETFNIMSTNFAGRYTWKDTDECKAMMLQYINSKHHLGFKAYKDEKTAFKDKVKIKK